ncbi:MAG: hypothetical protein DYG96_10970 [Chlorobi bacterium CHB2]|nr:hypothetical protein [Chlorobi bacterium CHB2]
MAAFGLPESGVWQHTVALWGKAPQYDRPLPEFQMQSALLLDAMRESKRITRPTTMQDATATIAHCVRDGHCRPEWRL